MMALGLFAYSVLACFGGLALIALTVPINRQRVFGRAPHKLAPRHVRRRRVAGAALAAAGAVTLVGSSGPSFGVPLAILTLSLGGYAVMAALAWAPGMFRRRGDVSSRTAD